MIPSWMFYAIYAVGGIVILAALVRIVLRRRAKPTNRASHDSPVAESPSVAGPGRMALQADARHDAGRAWSSSKAPSAKSQEASAGSVGTADRRIGSGPSPLDSGLSPRLFGDPRRRGDDDDDLPRIEADEVPAYGTADYLFGSATPALAALLPESGDRREKLKTELRNAGYYQPHAWQNFAALRYVGIAGSMVALGAALLFVPPQLEIPVLLLLIIVPLVCWALPRVFVRGKAADRISEIERGMPDMLDMLHMCVSQGLTVSASLRRISREVRNVYPALAQELAIVCDQAEIGTLEQALVNFSRRVDVPDVHSFTSLLVQTERMGTSVGQALTDYSDGMRETLRQRADTKANQSTFKLLFPTVLCLMPAVYLFLLGPAIVEFADFLDGGGLDEFTTNIQAAQDLESPGATIGN